jgi:catechol 2,3-dioxygenase-like lactoylglutathione lyase family enzyme
VLSETKIQTNLPAQDMDRARSFFSSKLGLEPTSETPAALIYDYPGGRFLITPTSGKPSGDHTQMSFWVSDISAEVQELKERGLEFVEYDLPDLKTDNSIATLGPAKAAWFFDSEGNMLGLFQPPAAG